MTREQILAMPAGVELDALVAEKVLCGKRCDCGDPECGAWFPPGVDMVDAQLLPHFSSDIACAWLVVEKMRDSGFAVQIISMILGRFGYRAEFGFNAGYVAEADTVTEAIAKAALLAKLNSQTSPG